MRNYEAAACATFPHPDSDPAQQFRDRDEDDVVFLAAALAVDGDVWSDDGVFKHQNLVTLFDTGQVIEYSDVEL